MSFCHCSSILKCQQGITLALYYAYALWIRPSSENSVSEESSLGPEDNSRSSTIFSDKRRIPVGFFCSESCLNFFALTYQQLHGFKMMIWLGWLHSCFLATFVRKMCRNTAHFCTTVGLQKRYYSSKFK